MSILNYVLIRKVVINISILDVLNKVDKNSDTFEDKFLTAFHKAHKSIADKEQQGNPKNYTRPSSLGGCMRRIYYMRKQYPKDTRPLTKMQKNSLGILEAGTDRHARIQTVLQEMESLGYLTNLDIAEQVKKANDMGIRTKFLGWNEDHTEARCVNEDMHSSFQPDGLIKMDDTTALVEIKTCSVNRFKQVKSKNAPFPDHLIQATTYALGLGVDKILYIYECRDNTERLPILVEVSELMKQAVLDKLNQVEQYVNNSELPPKETGKCFFCDYKDICKKDYNG